MLLLATLASCQKEANDLPQLGNYPEDGVVRIATQLNAIQTRAGEPTDYAGANLSLSVDYGTSDKYTVHNNEWTKSGSVWSTTSQMLWKSADAEAKIYAYAPFVDLGTTPDITNFEFSVAADQSAGLTASDLVGFKNENYKPSDNNNANKAIPIAFSHKLAKLKVELTFGDQFGGSNPAITGVTINETLPSTTYNATTASLVGEASGTARDIKTFVGTAVAGSAIYEAIIIPQVVAKDTRLVTIALDNNTSYHYTISAASGHDFKPNTENTIKLKIGKDKVSLASPIQVNDWTEGKSLTDGKTELAPPVIGNYYYTDKTYSDIYISDPNNPCLGVVFWIDDTNPYRGKLVSLDEGVGNWGESAFQESDNGVEGIGSLDDGASATKNLIIARKDQSNFATDYQVFNWIYEIKNGSRTVGRWYIPAKNELLALNRWWVKEMDTNIDILTSAGGTPITPGDYCASTEVPGLFNFADGVRFREDAQGGGTVYLPKQTPDIKVRAISAF